GQRLSDADIRRVIGRAAELQAEQPTEGALSMGAVEQIAAEVGIPPARVREAMGELQQSAAAPPAVPAPKRQKGDKVVIQRSLAGEVAEPTLREMVMDIESTLGIAGHVSVYGSSLTWSPASQGADERKVVVSVNSAGGATRIHVEERFELSGWRIFIPGWGVGVGVVTGLGVAAALGLQDAAMLLVAGPCGFAGAITAVNIYIQGGKRRRRPELEALVDRLAARVEGAALPPGDQR
ncbi:MAG TPA: hypothetical protein VLC48_02880, partial [Gemmatimonadota bacterium]|nr:hypothetical protein [Gemmatimonadota bacterium]